MKYSTLNNGVKMPMLGFGTFNIPNDQVEQAVTDAIDSGYRLIDTAQQYRNEEGVGKALAKTKVDRKDLFITTKIGIQNFGYEQTKKSLENSLKRLQLDYIDLVLLHGPYGDTYGAGKALEEAYKEGKVRAIGVSNFPDGRVEDLIKFNEIKPVENQIEMHPFYQRDEEVEYLKSRDIAPASGSSFARGEDNIFENPVLVEIANKYNKKTSQVVLRGLLQRDVTVIPKTTHKERMQENIDVFDFELSDEDMAKIKSLNKGKTLFNDPRDVESVDYMVERPFDK